MGETSAARSAPGTKAPRPSPPQAVARHGPPVVGAVQVSVTASWVAVGGAGSPGAPGACGKSLVPPVTVTAPAGSQWAPAMPAPKRSTRYQFPPASRAATSSCTAVSWALQVCVTGAVASGQARAASGYAVDAASVACGRVRPAADAEGGPNAATLRAVTR